MLPAGTHRLSTGATAHTTMSATMKADQPPRVSSGAGAGNWMTDWVTERPWDMG